MGPHSRRRRIPLRGRTPRPQTMTKSAKRRLARLLGLGLFLALFLGACELFVRLVFGDKIVLFPRFHEAAQYGDFTLRRLRPNTVFYHRSVDGSWRFQVNAQGFRDTHDYVYHKPPGLRRVLCLGDSHTQGFECDQSATYPQVLEQQARARRLPLEVLNAGISGFGTAEQLIFLEQEGFKYQPDWVVLGFFANDLDDNAKCALFRLEDGRLITNKWVHIPGVRALRPCQNFPLTRWLSQHSYLYSLVMNNIWAFMKNRLSRQAAEAAPVEYTIGLTNQWAAARIYQEKLTAALLQRLGQSCRARGVKLIVVEIPNRTGPASFEPSLPPALREVAATSADTVLWATNLFGRLPDHSVIFRPHGQWHLTETAHALIGEALADLILPQITPTHQPSPPAP